MEYDGNVVIVTIIIYATHVIWTTNTT